MSQPPHSLWHPQPPLPPHEQPRHHQHHHRPHRRHDRHPFDQLLRTMRLLARASACQGVADLTAIARRAGEAAVADLLTGFDPGLEADLAIDKLDVLLAEEASRRRRELHALARDKAVAVIAPLPPHLYDAFLHEHGGVVLVPDGEDLPPHLRRLSAELVVSGSRGCRDRVSALDIIVCEVFLNERPLVAAGASDLLDERILTAEVRLIGHARPHRRDDDMALREAVASRLELY
jgi:hypothetical protein